MGAAGNRRSRVSRQEFTDTYNRQLRDGMVVKAPEPHMIYHAPQPEQDTENYAW